MASRPVDSIARSASRTCAGRLSNASPAAAAWMVITLTLWPMTSCSSRAIRACSSAAARRTLASCSASSRLARSRRVRTLSPSSHAAPNSA